MDDAALDRVALVTGAGRGIGRAIATRLSAAGLRVVLVSRSRDELDRTAGACPGPTLVLPADVTAPGASDDLYERVEARWGTVSILVANAGSGLSAPLAQTTDEQWQQMLEVNLTAPFRFARRAVPRMVEQRYGRIVMIASTASKVGEPYIAAYAASKHGVLGLVRSAASELAGSGVTVNAVCPGYVDTPMTDRTIETIRVRTGRSAQEVRRVLAARQPHGRLVTPEEVAEAAWFAVSNASVNAQALNVDGGAVQS